MPGFNDIPVTGEYLKAGLDLMEDLKMAGGIPLTYQRTAPIEYAEPKLQRNDPCSCGSGKKYKKCCLKH